MTSPQKMTTAPSGCGKQHPPGFRPADRVKALRRWIFAILLAGSLGRPWCPETQAHAKPGAHADVRFSVSRSAVRVEALMNLRFVEGIVNWTHAVRDEVAPDEEAAGKKVLLEYFGGPMAGPLPAVLNRPNSVTIDTVPTQPVLVDFRVIRPAPETRPGFVEVAQALWQQVWVVVEYPCKASPRSVSLVWGTYPRDFLAPDRDLAPLSEVEAILVADGETQPLIFRDREPEFIWHASGIPLEERFQTVPSATPAVNGTFPALALAMGLAGCLAGILAWRGAPPRNRGRRSAAIALGTFAVVLMAWPYGRMSPPLWWTRPPPLPTADEALAIFQPLHANIYRAFDYTTESEIYDALARSVDGPLLGKTYDDIYRSLILQEEGGALCRVKSVELVST
ncbi:MAG: hypothetical protein KIT22_17110, partial [Verrucomicrobiae bacterium]|nr:hypothetical protein [Verrucomicrobiae bacterium]